MNETKETALAMRILPGVDLALWLRIVVMLVFVAVSAGLVLATA